MNALRNRVQLIGNLGNDPEVMETSGGKKRAKLAIATNETYRNAQGELVKDTQWHTVVVWGKLAEVVERYLRKGTEVAIEGKLQTRSYEDSSGNRKYITEINCLELLMLGHRSE